MFDKSRGAEGDGETPKWEPKKETEHTPANLSDRRTFDVDWKPLAKFDYVSNAIVRSTEFDMRV